MIEHRRKDIRLKGYDYTQCNAYFITICTYGRAEVFEPLVGAHLRVRPVPRDIICRCANDIIIKWLFELENKYEGCVIDQFVIMPDHIHFIIFNLGKIVDKVHIGTHLSEIVKWYKTQTTNEYIRLVKNDVIPPFDKHIWQRSYYEHIIRSSADYEQICDYIYHNPDKLYSPNDPDDIPVCDTPGADT